MGSGTSKWGTMAFFKSVAPGNVEIAQTGCDGSLNLKRKET